MIDQILSISPVGRKINSEFDNPQLFTSLRCFLFYLWPAAVLRFIIFRFVDRRGSVSRDFKRPADMLPSINHRSCVTGLNVNDAGLEDVIERLESDCRNTSRCVRASV